MSGTTTQAINAPLYFRGDTKAPPYLYNTRKVAKSTPPTALFDPVAALSGHDFGASISAPRASVTPKNLIITLHTWQCSSSAQLYALIVFLHQEKFNIYFWIDGKAEFFPADAPQIPVQEALTIFSKLDYFNPKKDSLKLGGEPEDFLCLDTLMTFKILHDLDNYNTVCPVQTDSVKCSLYSMGNSFPEAGNNQEYQLELEDPEPIIKNPKDWLPRLAQLKHSALKEGFLDEAFSSFNPSAYKIAFSDLAFKYFWLQWFHSAPLDLLIQGIAPLPEDLFLQMYKEMHGPALGKFVLWNLFHLAILFPGSMSAYPMLLALFPSLPLVAYLNSNSRRSVDPEIVECYSNGIYINGTTDRVHLAVKYEDTLVTNNYTRTSWLQKYPLLENLIRTQSCNDLLWIPEDHEATVQLLQCTESDQTFLPIIGRKTKIELRLWKPIPQFYQLLTVRNIQLTPDLTLLSQRSGKGLPPAKEHPPQPILLKIITHDSWRWIWSLTKTPDCFQKVECIDVYIFLKDRADCFKWLTEILLQLIHLCPNLKLIQAQKSLTEKLIAAMSPDSLNKITVLPPDDHFPEVVKAVSEFISIYNTPTSAPPPTDGHPQKNNELQWIYWGTQNAADARSYIMKPVGVCLNHFSPSPVFSSRALIDITPSCDPLDPLHSYIRQPNIFSVSLRVTWLSSKNLSDYKRTESEQFYYLMEVTLKKGQRTRLHSVHSQECLVGFIRPENEQKDAGKTITVVKDGHGYFYIHATGPKPPQTLQYILSLRRDIVLDDQKFQQDFMDPSTTFSNPSSQKAKEIILKFVRSPKFSLQATPENLRALQETTLKIFPPTMPKIITADVSMNYRAWLTDIYNNCLGSCMDRSAAVSTELQKQSLPWKVECINGNHCALAIEKSPGSFVLMDVLGGVSIEKTIEAPSELMAQLALGGISDQQEDRPYKIIQKDMQNKKPEHLLDFEACFEPLDQHTSCLLISNSKKGTDTLALALLSRLKQKTPLFFYIHNAQELNIKKTQVLFKDKAEDPFQLEIQEGNALARFLDQALDQARKPSEESRPAYLVINWNHFTRQEITAWMHDLFDQQAIHDRRLPKNLKIIGLCSTELSKDLSFTSRHQPILSVFPLTHQKPKESETVALSTTIPINLEGLSWEKHFLGRVYLQDNQLAFEPGSFFSLSTRITDALSAPAASAGGGSSSAPMGLEPPFAPIKIVFHHVRLEEQTAFQEALDLAKARGYFLYLGKKLLIPECCDFAISHDAFDFAIFETSGFIPAYKVLKQKPEEAVVINSYLFDVLLKDKEITESTGFYSEKDGLLKRSSGQSLSLFISNDLTLAQWWILLKRAQEYAIILNLYATSDIKIPDGLCVLRSRHEEPTEGAGAGAGAGAEVGTGTGAGTGAGAGAGDTRDLDLEKPESTKPLTIYVEDLTFSDLFYGTKFTMTPTGCSDFSITKSDLLTQLIKGQDVILKGTFSPDLLAYLAPILQSPIENQMIQINGQMIKLKGHLTIEIDNPDSEKLMDLGRAIYIESDRSTESLGRLENAREFIQNRVRQLFFFFNNDGDQKAMRLAGHSGVGKSSLIREIETHYQKFCTVYRGLENLHNWALDTLETSSKTKILFIDEHNIDDIHFTFLEPFFRNQPVLWQGTLYTLGSKHRIVFAGNHLNYGGGRVEQKLFKLHTIHQMQLRDFPPCYIRHCILGEIFTPDTASLVKEEKITALIQNYLKANQAIPESMTVRTLQQQALELLWTETKKSEDSERPRRKKVKMDEEGDEDGEKDKTLPYQQAGFSIITQALDIKRAQRRQQLPSQGMGLNGLWIEGPPGIGKSFMIQDALKKAAYCLQDPEAGPSADPRTAYVMMSASLSLKEKEKILLEAFHQGLPVVLEEADCCMADGLEKILNSLLTGLDLEGNPARTPGFMWIGTGNGPTYHGRTALSPALQKRCLMLKIEHPKKEDILLLLQKYSETIPKDQHPFFANAFIQLQSTGEMSLKELLEYLDQKKPGDPLIQQLATMMPKPDFEAMEEPSDAAGAGAGAGGSSRGDYYTLRSRHAHLTTAATTAPLWAIMREQATGGGAQSAGEWWATADLG